MGKVEAYAYGWDDELENMLGSILDFPESPMEGNWDAANSQYLGPIPMDLLMGSQLCMHTPPIDTAKQHSYWFDDDAPGTGTGSGSGSCIRRHNKSVEVQEGGTFHSQSPISVLESSSSSKSLLKPRTAKRARSKRARSSRGSPWLIISPFLSSSRKTKQRRKKQSMEEEPANAAAQPRPTKKCTHCEITKTPQWREGPQGPKTLCNACGVRYRSNRLFPEYRPAASPTFVPTLHSNSHKKVIEMRHERKSDQPSMSPQLEFVPASSSPFDPIF